MEQKTIQTNDKVRVGGRMGVVISIEPRLKTSIYTVAFSEGPPQKIISPPTPIEKIYSPSELLETENFTPSINFDFHFEAVRLSLAYKYDRFLSLSSTRTNLEPYQVEAAWRVLNSYKHRFLIADDVGLGKTIEAGMILKELSLRGRAKRVLIIVPAPLRYQWQREMRDRFDEQFIIYEAAYLKVLKDSLPKDANVWEAHDKVITSIDYAKKEEVLAELERTKWDLIILDEAHKLSASKYGNKIQRSLRYRLAETLNTRAESFLLLTATPHRGDSFAFYSLISLIDPYIFESETKIFSSKLNSIMIRRGKDGLKDEKGKPIFRPRDVFTLPVNFTEDENRLYNAVTDYVRGVYNSAKSLNNRAVGFAMVLLQKRMVSSIAAIRESLKNRLSNLIKAEVSSLSRDEEMRLRDYIEDPDSMDDWEKENFERKLETLSLPSTPEALKIEIETLKHLIKMAEEIKVDSKARRLIEFVKGILENPKEKILIFTEYRDTLSYLLDLLGKEGFNPVTIHGEMPMGERREAEELFKSEAINIMAATDAAGEGINLQFCHIMVNYDLPWNPNRIDQRIGRLHRYGQKRDVKVHNLFISNTREGEILTHLMQKVAKIEEELGGKISDIVGLVLEGVKLEEVIMNALSENKPIEVALKDVEGAIEERKIAYRKIEDAFLMDLKKFDLDDTLKVIEESWEYSASEEDIEKFIRAFFNHFGGKIEPTKRKGVYRLHTPKEVLREGVKDKYDRITFSKEIAKELGVDKVEFLAFGHPLFEAIIDYARDKNWTFGGRVTVKCLKNNEKSGLLLNFIMRFRDANGELLCEEILPILVDFEGKIKRLNPKQIADFIETPKRIVNNSIIKEFISKREQLQNIAKDCAIDEAKKFSAKVQKEKDRKIEIKKVDAKRYFESRIKEENRRIAEYKSSLSKGKDMEIAIRGAEKRLEYLKSQYKEVLERLQQEGLVIEEMPELFSIAGILPSQA
jgi:SNF2 family DNA or RNA helicase